MNFENHEFIIRDFFKRNACGAFVQITETSILVEHYCIYYNPKTIKPFEVSRWILSKWKTICTYKELWEALTGVCIRFNNESIVNDARELQKKIMKVESC